jgi:SAM-dependent methyltransferase
MTAGIDVQAFTEFEQYGWQRAVDPYEKYFGPLTVQTGAAMLEAVAGDCRGKSLLDLATGPGFVAKRAAAAGCARVVGIDFSAPMVALARSAAAGVDFRQGDAQQLDLADAGFDAVTMNFGMLHLAQPARAIAEAFRVLRPGGRFGFTVWADARKSIGFGPIMDAIAAHADKGLSVPAGPPFFYFSEREVCFRHLRDAGFVEPSFREIDMLWRFDAAEDYYTVMLHGTARTAGVLRLQTAATLESIHRAVLANCAGFMRSGKLELPMCAVLAVGTRPG